MNSLSTRRMVNVALVLAMVLAGLMSLVSVPTAKAAPFTIPDGDVAALIAAITTANGNSEADTIELVAGGTYVLTAVTGDLIGDSGLPVVTSQITIYGNGATITRSTADGTPEFRVFTVASGGNLTLEDVTISNGIAMQGAGIYVNNATLRLNNSTVVNNHATYQGGGIDSNSSATSIVTNSTISGNTAPAYGGGIITYGWLTITNSTISDNSTSNGGGIYDSEDRTTMTNTIVAGNTASNSWVDVRGEMSGTNNLIGDGTGMTGLVNSVDGNQVGTAANPIDPLLGPLQDNGGPTPTMALLPGSPAIDAGTTTSETPTTDQRGIDRPQGTSNDIGAFELVPDTTPPTITPTITGTLGTNGWYTSDVSVSWSVTDPESSVNIIAGCESTTITTDTTSQTLTCQASSLGGEASDSVLIKRDATAPVVEYIGNLGTYGLTDTIGINCSVSDAHSGIATHACAAISGSATTYGPGMHTFSATAIDIAGNVGSATTSFVIGVSYAQLCTLTKDVASHPILANAACASLILAQRADQANNAQVERVALTLFRFQIRLAMAFRAISTSDGQNLLDWLEAVD